MCSTLVIITPDLDEALSGQMRGKIDDACRLLVPTSANMIKSFYDINDVCENGTKVVVRAEVETDAKLVPGLPIVLWF